MSRAPGSREDAQTSPAPPRPAVSPPNAHTRPWPWLRLAALGAGAATLFAVVALSGPLSAARVHHWVDGYGSVGGPLAFVVVSSCLTVALFPGPLLAAASGALFGTGEGTVLSIISATLGATLAFSISRWLAGDTVEQLGGPRLRAVSAWVGRRGFLSVLYARIVPGVPYTWVNYAAGLTPVRVRAFVAATALGVAPRAYAYTALGGHLGNLTSPAAIGAFAVLVAMAIGGLALARREQLAERARRGSPGAP